MFSFDGFIILVFKFGCLNNFELIFVYGVKYVSNFILLFLAIQFS